MSTLKEHRVALTANSNAFEADVHRLPETLASHLKNCGYRRASGKNARPLVAEMVEAIFDAQGRRPFFHIDAALPYCWNAPRYWNCDFIRYEWGHLRSRNQNADADDIENLAPYSARCNQHIQTAMNLDEVHDWLTGSRVAARIEEVLTSRAQLFRSERWKKICMRLKEFA